MCHCIQLLEFPIPPPKYSDGNISVAKQKSHWRLAFGFFGDISETNRATYQRSASGEITVSAIFCLFWLLDCLAIFFWLIPENVLINLDFQFLPEHFLFIPDFLDYFMKGSPPWSGRAPRSNRSVTCIGKVDLLCEGASLRGPPTQAEEWSSLPKLGVTTLLHPRTLFLTTPWTLWGLFCRGGLEHVTF